MKNALFAILLLLLLAPAGSQAQTAKPYRVAVKELNFREEPSRDVASKGKLREGEQVDVIEIRKADAKNIRWARIVRADGTLGYAALSEGKEVYLEPVPNAPAPAADYCTYFMFDNVKVDALSLTGASPSKDPEVDYIIADILFLAGGLQPDFKIMESTKIGDNCAALPGKGKDKSAYILINRRFLATLRGGFGEMPLYVVLAHEAAHHFDRHSVVKHVTRQDELEADYFSGSILRQLGLDRESELEAAIAFLGNYRHGKGTHPALAERRAEIKRGWASTTTLDRERTLRRRLEHVYDDVDKFHNGFARVRKGGVYGFVNRVGREVIRPSFSSAEDFNDDGYAQVWRNGRRLIINKYGQTR